MDEREQLIDKHKKTFRVTIQYPGKALREVIWDDVIDVQMTEMGLTLRGGEPIHVLARYRAGLWETVEEVRDGHPGEMKIVKPEKSNHD